MTETARRIEERLITVSKNFMWQCVPGQQTGTIFVAMLTHILSASIHVPNVAACVVEMRGCPACMNKKGETQHRMESLGRKEGVCELFSIPEEENSLLIFHHKITAQNAAGKDIGGHLTQPPHKV